MTIGRWHDESQGHPLVVLADGRVAALTPNDLVESVVNAARDSELNPWEHELRIKHYYANASSTGWEILVSVAPYFRELLDPENLRIAAGALLGAIFARLIGQRTEGEQNQVTVQEAVQRAKDYCVRTDNLAPTQLEEISAELLSDQTFEILLRRSTDTHHLLCRVDQSGFLVLRFDMDALNDFVARVKAEFIEQETQS